MDFNFKLTNLFKKDNLPVKWALHTTMTAEPTYLAALAAMQTRGKDIAGTLKNPPDVAFFYNKKSTPTCTTALKPTHPLRKLKDKMFPVDCTNQTFHAKLSLVCFEGGSYRLAVYSKNCDYASDKMLEVAALFDLSFDGEKNENGTQLTSFFAHLFDHTTDAGKQFLTTYNICQLFSQHVTLTEVPTSNYSPKTAQIYFGGCGGDALSAKMKFTSIDTTNSVILTPPAFMIGTSAETYFSNKPIIWDAKPDFQSHAKLYLLQHNNTPDIPQTHSLWLGSANCTTRGIGYDFSGQKKQIQNQSVECLVKFDLSKREFDLSKDEFNQFKKSLGTYYQPYVWGTPPSLANKQTDYVADFFVNQCSLNSIVYLDNRDQSITKLDSKTYVKSIKYEFSYADPLPLIPIPIPFFPLEYRKEDHVLMEITSNTVTLYYRVNGNFRRSQGYLSVGVSGSLIAIPIHLMADIPMVNGPINLLNRPYLSEILSMEDGEATKYLTQCIAQLEQEKEQATDKSRLQSAINTLTACGTDIQGGENTWLS